MIHKPRIYTAITTFFPLVNGTETQTYAQCQRLIERGYYIADPLDPNTSWLEVEGQTWMMAIGFQSGHHNQNRTLYHHRNTGERIDTLLCVE